MNQDQKQCVACREKIMEGALVCPKCRSPQQPQRWGTFFSVLKWIGGFTAIISLIIGVKQISGIVQEWQERDEAVNHIVTASRMLMDMKDYQAAWKIANKATAIAPSSRKAFNQQVDVALVWVRNIWVQKGEKTYSEIIDPLILTLSQGAGDENPKRSAEVLAHIGWANLWRLRDKKAEYEVDGYFRLALERNPDDTYANLFNGYWLLTKESRSKDNRTLINDALHHFSRAIRTGVNPNFVYLHYISALTRSEIIGADVEAVKIANDWRKQKAVPLERPLRQTVLPDILSEFDGIYRTQLSEGTFLPRLLLEFSIQDARDTYVWLFEEVDNKDDWWEHAKLMHLGLISEAEGELENAFDLYVELISKVIRSGSGYQEQARIALSRIIAICHEVEKPKCGLPNNATPENTINLNESYKLGIDLENNGLYLRKLYDGPAMQGGLMMGDMLLMIDNNTIVNRTQLSSILQDIASGKIPGSDLLVLRKSDLIRFRIVKGLD